MSKKKDILRVGEYIEISDPRVVDRVGYPKCHADYLPEVTEKHKVAVEALFRTKRMRKRAYSNLAYEALGAAGFGGKERSVHLRTVQDLVGIQATVQAARTVMTGKHYGPSGGYNSYDGDYDYEPGGLSNVVYVRLVTVYTPYGSVEIPAAHCKRVET